ncbi:hypothetical protein A3G50_00200 [Candidatus Jorgensenbacteria bacterium RIFCSPLOWO2_12_FULL_42_11]|uniref:Metallo-beta-lactamase domain-containing protein n=1 Tax=Candidatus Jorgensenbacteria bacterium RIFCSPLOWO2_12_FULL_42_11 TaxID=1798473 RepID=A0A1F6C2D3_9BACT|nr:MAG: hypothetical protein A3G50_00200 [Candidatus Jorgensenbacteria bacterium RIFCSPLOWO2_12_FULL_42_11]
MKNRNIALVVALFLSLDIFVWRTIALTKPSDNLNIYFLSVGQGDSELVILPGGVKILIDAGPDNKVIGELDSILRPTERYIDLVIVSHPQADHFNGFIDVLKHYQVGAFIHNGRAGAAQSWKELAQTVKENKIPAVALAAGDKINYLESKLDILSPNENFINSKELNDTVLVALLQSQSAKVLFTGDVGKKIEDYLINKLDFKVDVLKVAHHGSKYSSGREFLAAILPKISVIEVGKNSYGHPTEEVLNRLAAVGAAIYRTDRDGTIKMVFPKKSSEIQVFKKK